jgi:hypothetical protein
MRDCDIEATGILQEEASPCTWCRYSPSGALVMIWIALPETFHHSLASYDKSHPPGRIVENVGGAYAVLPYVAQQAVQHYGWLTAGQMLDGLGLAERTPGPLIMITQFVGFLGASSNSGQLPPILAATLGALVTTWSTFVPCFLWIFLGGP